MEGDFGGDGRESDLRRGGSPSRILEQGLSEIEAREAFVLLPHQLSWGGLRGPHVIVQVPQHVARPKLGPGPQQELYARIVEGVALQVEGPGEESQLRRLLAVVGPTGIEVFRSADQLGLEDAFFGPVKPFADLSVLQPHLDLVVLVQHHPTQFVQPQRRLRRGGFRSLSSIVQCRSDQDQDHQTVPGE